MSRQFVPFCLSNCADCGVGTFTIGEYYMVKDDIWEEAWAGRRKSWTSLPGQEILCIGCLESRIGRTLMSCDFTDSPVNRDDHDRKSDRLINRLTTQTGYIKGGLDGLIEWMAQGWLKKLPKHERDRAYKAWQEMRDEL